MRTALVTGGSAGIGAGICRHLLEDGYTVINLSRRPSPVEHERMHDYPVDLSDLEATAQVAAQVTRDHQVTDLVHNAGVIRPALLGSVDLADLEMVSNIHIGAAITLAQAVLPGMRAAGNGRIVLISSRAALGLQTRTCYSATKSGMMGMARTWALELGPEGITVNVVAPGPIAETEMFDDAIREQEKRDAIAASIPMQRLGNPADVARAVKFFLSPDNSFVTGQTLLVCGGASLGSLSL
ncbi:MAG: SDR family oxidoreductase [Haliea sp.]|jgi:NAD(P)-dependent dehydrogenase (short-subunit alcohol dehydrogenase family)|nr:SDR family oxidoreductase [Haliea sp.]